MICHLSGRGGMNTSDKFYDLNIPYFINPPKSNVNNINNLNYIQLNYDILCNVAINH